ncbi:MAG: CDP-alcohol phosphatidyltransferase family protein [Rhizobiales bacterium]|nr:CDP-alcohol phosphatidyltransferase family protein [Hyphomicrobiales bacterium]
MNIPNLITIGRMIIVPIVVWLIFNGNFLTAFWLFLAAGISDGVDGFIAKQFNQETELGAYLDPLADKALLVSIYVALGIRGELPVWLVILVASRDIFIVAGVILAWMMDMALTMQPHMVSKINTTAQIMLATLVLGGLGFELEILEFRHIAVVSVAVLTILSLAVYLVAWLRHMTQYEDDEERSS